MPIIKSAKKAARQSVKRTAHNRQIKQDIKSATKDFKKNPTCENLSKAQSELDKAVKKNLIHKNTAARRKSALAKLVVLTKTTKPVAKKTTTKKAVAKTTSK